MDIKKIACVGAGWIGHNWATLFATKGFPVVLYDLSDEILTEALRKIRLNMNFLVKNEIIKKELIKEILARIQTTTDLEKAVKSVDYIQECVSESQEIKKTVFKEMDKLASDDTILSSSSDGVSITELQKATKKPERCIRVHPWNPLLLIPLVEIVKGEKTSEETVEASCELMQKLDKVPVVLRKEALGLIVHRIEAAMLREAIELVDKGIASVEDIDKAIRTGPALRWALTGIFLTHHLGPGGRGIERYMGTLVTRLFTHIWKDMATWTTIQPSAYNRVIEEVNKLDIVCSKKMDESVNWRNKKMIDLLKTLGYL